MSGKLLLGLVVAALMIGEVSAQSGSRGFSSGGAGSRGSGAFSSGNFRNQALLNQQRIEQQQRLEQQRLEQERVQAEEARRIQNEIIGIEVEIQKENLAGVSLDDRQKKVLKDLVGSNYKAILKNQNKMQSLVPKRQAVALQRVYTESIGNGKSRTDATLMSMESIGLSSSLQSKVMRFNNKNEAIKQKITTKVIELFDEEQKQMLMAKKEAMQAEKTEDAKEVASN